MARFDAIEAKLQLVDVKVDLVETAENTREGRVKELEERDRVSSLRGGLPQRPNEGYIPQKQLMPKSFNDKPEEWRAWREDVLDWIDSVNPGVKEVLEELCKWEDWDEFDFQLLMQGKSERVKDEQNPSMEGLEESHRR